MTTADTRNYAKAVKVREGLMKIREDIMKAHGQGRNVKPSEMLKKYNLYPKTMTWLIELGAITEGDSQGQEGRRLNWVYQGNVNGVVDQQLIDRIIKEERDYSKSRKEIREALNPIEKEESKPKTTMKKLPTGNLANINNIIVWLDEELAKEEQVPGYLRSSTKVMYQTIKQVVGDIKPAIENLRKAIEDINL